MELSYPKLVKDYDLSLLRRKSLNILVLYSLVTITILFLLFFTPVTGLYRSDIDKFFIFELTFLLSFIYWLRLISGVIDFKLIFTQSKKINFLASIFSLGLTLIFLYFASISQNIFLFLLIPVPTICIRLIFGYYFYSNYIK